MKYNSDEGARLAMEAAESGAIFMGGNRLSTHYRKMGGKGGGKGGGYSGGGRMPSAGPPSLGRLACRCCRVLDSLS